ncbi:MAG: hypothetical protein N2044_01250 [Cyclobacteriaceae bacterium]|nr:hypothetical protein [Cyclobacteriaceae bacterium]MCX7636448.1 hypothetical protein [Cyclobacteriaceae bacterium]MDW8330767.1 hypothetical protein [Cyclobacteriaceae bacterium]
MFVPLETLPENARVWIYPLSRDLNEVEKSQAENKLRQFVSSWKAHGHDLRASFKLLQNRFIVLAADELHHAPSGCSIDASVHAVKEIVATLGVDLASRGQVFFVQSNTINPVSVGQLRKDLEAGKWNADSLVFDASVTTLGELERNPVPASQTWLARYFERLSV